MSWEYRTIDFGDHAALHEVHYEGRDDTKPRSFSAEPATFEVYYEHGDKPEHVVEMLERALIGARKPLLHVRSESFVERPS